MASYDSCAYLTPSGWNALLSRREPREPLVGDIDVKYLVIGAGYAGLSVARRLAELDPLAGIAIIEAGTVGENASGRNSGFISPQRLTETAHKSDGISEYNKRGLQEVTRLVEENRIECGLAKTGGFRCSATERGEQELQRNLEFLKKRKLPHEYMGRRELETEIGTSYFRSGLFVSETFQLQPAKLVRGLADTMPAQVRLYENTKAHGMKRDGHWRITTKKGAIKAKVVVLAANTFARNLGYLSEYLMAVYTYAALTPKLNATDLSSLGRSDVWGIAPTFKYGTTMRRLKEGRLMVRSLYSYEREDDLDVVRRGLIRSLRNHFPQLPKPELEFVWGGILSLTRGRAPFFGKLGEGLYSLAGCNGSGITKFVLLGRYLAEEIAGEHRMAGVIGVFGRPGWMPPEPFRRVGFKVVSTIGKRLAGRDK